MWGLSLFTAIMLIALGVAIGIYIASQISEHIDCKTRHKKFMHDMENFDKNKKYK
jgi:predicted RND superfamily exporter protein